jgi:Tol biopolymer transport system component
MRIKERSGEAALKGGNPVKLTSEKGMYRQPSYATDGAKIVFYKEGGNSAMGYAYTVKPGIYTMNANGRRSEICNR